ncbi:MAG: NAD(P)/FAD-dependent oxidoreductase [Nannocystaceae bacterium]
MQTLLDSGCDTDVVVIGAGPAGCTAASLLHRAGLKVMVLERTRFPRFVIGESLLLRCMEILKEAGFFGDLCGRGYLRKHGAVFLRGKDSCEFKFGDSFTPCLDYAWQVPRDDFDQTLACCLIRMGVPVHFGHRVVDATIGDQPRVEFVDEEGEAREVACRFIVDASGYGRVLPGLLDLDRRSELPQRRSIFAHVRGDRRPTGAAEGDIWVAALAADAWTWVIPFADGRTSIGVVASPEYFSHLPTDPEASLLQCMNANQCTRQRLAGVEIVRAPDTINGYSIGVKRFYGPGYCLIGNATEFLDPVFSSGICLALESASRAATVIIAQLAGETVSWKTEYAEPMERGLEVFRAYVDAWYDETLPAIFFGENKQPDLQRMVCGLLAGYAWDLDNPYVREPRRKCAQLRRLAGLGARDASTGLEAASSHEQIDFDVVICGGGLAGLCLARQIRREMPGRSVAVVEPQSRPLPEACHKVGESSVELGSLYLDRLGLRDYMHDRHLIKYGLRFFPGGGSTLPLDARTEIGPTQDPLVTSYQIDRGRLENDLRAMVEADGVTMFEGAAVGEIEFGRTGDLHRIYLRGERAPALLRSRWVVDATGREALLRKQLKLTRGVPHGASSCWFRVRERVDVAQLVPKSCIDWHAHDPYHKRWLSTVHLMGEGYWVWIIPLSSGYTSIGVVVHDHVHRFEAICTLERAMEWLAEYEPTLRLRLQGVDIADFVALRTYSYSTSRAWSVDRWATVGEAAAFGDPLYSPGTDFIAYANTLTVEAMKSDAEGIDFEGRVQQFTLFYRALYTGAIETVRVAAPVYGHASAMAAKIYWDNFSYWSFSCQYFIQKVYAIPLGDQAPLTAVGERFIGLHRRVQGLPLCVKMFPDKYFSISQNKGR